MLSLVTWRRFVVSDVRHLCLRRLRQAWYDVFMDDDESMDRLRWEVIASEAVREARQPIGRDEVFAILSFERDQGAPAAITERVIVF